MSGKKRDVALPAALLVACLLLYFVWFIRRGLIDLGHMSLFSSFDYQSYFRPRFWLGSEELRHFRLPLWNPYEYGGIPLLAAGQPAALYPPKVLLYALFEPVTAHWAFLVLHWAVLSGTFFLFLRQQGVSGAGLFVGAAVVAFSTPLLQSNYHPVRIACITWMPLEFLLAERVARDGSLKAFAGLALTVTTQLFAGYPEFSIDTGALLAVHATASWLAGRWTRPPWKTVPWLAAAFVLGAVGAAAQLVPLGELAGVAQRVAVAARPAEVPEVLKHRAVPIVVLPGFIVFAVLGFWLPRARVAAAGFAACWLMGAGGWKLLRYLPGFSMVRFPLGWVLLSMFFVAWLAAIGCDAVERPEGLGPRLRKASFFLVAASGLGLSTLWVVTWMRSARPPGSPFYNVNVGNPEALAYGVLGGIALAAVAGVSLTGRRVPMLAWLAAAGALALGHLAGVPHGSETAPFRLKNETGRIATLHRRPQAVQGRTLSPTEILYGYEITDRLPSALGIELSFLPERQRKIQERLRFAPMLGGIDWLRVVAARGFLDAMDVEFVLAPAPLIPLLAQHGIFIVRHGGADVLFRNPTSMGHAWVNHSVRLLSSGDAVLSHVLSSRFDPRSEVVLEDLPRGTYPGPDPAARPFTPVTAERRHSPTDVEYRVELDRPGVLVASESAYPGWIATLDGEPTECFRADYVLRAVEVPAGTHTVRFQYRPTSVMIGLLASGLGLSAIIAVLVASRSRRPPKPAVS